MNSDFVIAVFSATIVLLLLASFSIIFTLIHKKKQKENRTEKELLNTYFQEEILKTKLEIQEQTLRHISYELHDNFGQIASLIKINLNTLPLDDKYKLPDKIENIKDLVRQLITDLKSLSVSLNTDRITNVGLETSLENEVERLRRLGPFTISLVKDGDFSMLNSSTSIVIFRMVQEILNNVLKHSSASEVKISLVSNEGVLTLAVQDDGIGFNTDEKISGTGEGLTNLHNRAKFIKAHISIQSSLGKGTIIIIELPLI